MSEDVTVTLTRHEWNEIGAWILFTFERLAREPDVALVRAMGRLSAQILDRHECGPDCKAQP